jgi:multiple sugar transport system ATP-binding protein
LLCGVRPEHVHFADDSPLRAEVLATEYLGTRQVVTLMTASGGTVRAKVDVNSPAKRGDNVGLRFDAAAVSLFDKTSGLALRTARDDAAPRPSHRSPRAVVAFEAGAAHG